ncbi:hypothetical protein ACOSP7_009769 [Xanthoceras sorbifolium]
MKCCSLKRKDLNFHFKKMSHKYYMLNGLNDETLRQVYINSLPDELQAEIHRHMASTRRDLRNTSLVHSPHVQAQILLTNMISSSMSLLTLILVLISPCWIQRSSLRSFGPTIPSISKQLMVNSSLRSSLQRKGLEFSFSLDALFRANLWAVLS